MAASRTATRSSARERARQRRLELDAERAARDAQIEDATAAFYESADTCEDLREQIAAAETAMGTAIQTLLDLKESPQRIQALLDIDATEYKRLKPSRPRLAAVAGESEGGGRAHEISDEQSAVAS